MNDNPIGSRWRRFRRRGGRLWRSKYLPTDLEILNAICDRYDDELTAFGSPATTPRRTQICVPIDSAVIAKDLGVDPDIVFGRLHYHLEHLYAYTDAEDDSKVHLFTSEIEEGRWCVNVPYVASVLAVLRYEHGKYFVALW